MCVFVAKKSNEIKAKEIEGDEILSDFRRHTDGDNYREGTIERKGVK